MSISRNFLVMGAIYLLVGICFGMYMGASKDHTLAPVHAHINLLGFTLMTVFGLAYRVMPQMAEGSLAKAHFWLHQVGAFVLLVGLFLLMSGKAVPGIPAPILPLAEGLVLLSVVIWLVNVIRRA
jgi:heme/copper-type cytochrome/quinol oxidase subunit 1